MEPIAALIFDMDGTLVDNMRYHDAAWVAFMEEVGLPIDIEQFFRDTAGRTNPEIMREYLGAHLPPDEIARHAARKEHLYRERYRPYVQEVAGLCRFLDAARASGLKLAVATAASPDSIAMILPALGLDTFFDAVVSSVDVPRGKPFPDIFLKAAELLGATPEQCVVFEDAPMGIEAARRAGIRTIVVETSLSAHELAARPEVWFSIPDFTTPRLYELLPDGRELVAEESR